MSITWRKETIADVITLLLGAGLFLSPWLFGFATQAAATWTAWLTGLVIAALAIAALAAYAEWEVWASLALGIWAAVSPWLVAFQANMAATWTHVAAGLAVAVVAAARLWMTHYSRRGVTA